ACARGGGRHSRAVRRLRPRCCAGGTAACTHAGRREVGAGSPIVSSPRQSAAAIAFALVAAGAAVPLPRTGDARLGPMLDAWRTCGGETLAALVRDVVGPVGVAVLVAVALRALWSRRLGPVDVVRMLAALGVGVVLIGELKEFLRRPRPGAEVLGPEGA